MDSHEEIKKHFKLDDSKDKLCPIEITPDKGYLYPEKSWTLKFDDICPDWWKQGHEAAAFAALERWKKEVYSKINLKKARKPINPFKLKSVKKINSDDVMLLKKWDSVRDSVLNSVGDSVWDSVGDSVRRSVRCSVGDGVWDSVRGSVGDSALGSVGSSVWGSVWSNVRGSVSAYMGSLFVFKRNEWKNTKKIKTRGYPFQSAVMLWKKGLVPSFDGKIWRLHTGKDARVVFEIEANKLKKMTKNKANILMKLSRRR